MKELKNKKTGKIAVISDEEYASMRNSPILNRFTVTDLRMRPIVPSLKNEIPIEIKKIKKHEG